ncbi:hypothetical protein G6F22_017366 [Rhizopus arrhizus]|nr:hypothetical protein G6F22_017366 [Rhizopus arrhizus]
MHTPSKIKPAVVIADCSGCSRAPSALDITSQTSGDLCACSSSTRTACGFRPSNDSAFAGSGLNTELSYEICSWFLPSWILKLRSTPRDRRAQRRKLSSAGRKMAMACSRVVAMVYTSAPISPSIMKRYAPWGPFHVLLPFLRATSSYPVLNRRRPSARSQPYSTAVQNFCHGSSKMGCLASGPRMCTKFCSM